MASKKPRLILPRKTAMSNLTFGELIALIFFVPITIAMVYTLIVLVWINVCTREFARNVIAIFNRRENRSDKSLRDRD